MAGIKYEFILKMVQERAKKRGGGEEEEIRKLGEIINSVLSK